ncbi:unnamed protein product [Pylaiella littoralis]
MTPHKEALANTPLKKRTQLAIAAAVGLPQSTFRRRMKDLGVKPQTRYVKPLLRDRDKIARLMWARKWTAMTADGTRKFDGMGNVVHMDEKWFHVCNVKQRFYVRDDEPAPTRQVQHNNHITKVMFLGVVGRPRRNTSNNSNFSGKIGIYPFTVQERDQRSSRKRAAGPMVTTTVEVTKGRYKKMMLDHLRLPRPPAAASPADKIVWVQQDNARPYLINDDPDLRVAMTADGWDIRLINQPANSPDTNILDLVFLNSIQSLQDRTTPRSVDNLVKAVKEAWRKDPPAVLNRV